MIIEGWMILLLNNKLAYGYPPILANDFAEIYS